MLPVATLATAATTAASSAATATTATAAAESPAAAAASTATTAAATLAHRPSFVHDDVASLELLAVQRLNRTVCLFVILDFDKTEASRLSRETIANESNIRRSHTCLSKPFSDFFFRRLKWEIPHVKLLHLHTPLN